MNNNFDLIFPLIIALAITNPSLENTWKHSWTFFFLNRFDNNNEFLFNKGWSPIVILYTWGMW